MRRVLALVVVAAAIAVGAGLAIPSSAITVNADQVSQSQLNDELAAIAASPSYQCYLQAQAYLGGTVAPTSITGTTSQSWWTPSAVEWSNIRVTDLALVGFVEVHDPSALFAANLATARASLERQITTTIQGAYSQAGTSGQSFSCAAPKVGAATLASMPGWFQDEQVQATAADLGLVHLLPSTVPESGPALEAWFHQNAAQFDTTCISWIIRPDPTTAQVIATKIKSGAVGFADAAKKYSTDTSTGAKGGALGCFSPSSSSWQTVQHYVGTVPVGHVSQVYLLGRSYAIFTVTKRTPNTFDGIHAAVASQAAAINQANASLLAAAIQRGADIAVSPTLGTWAPTTLGGTIVPPSAPPSSSVLNATANSPAL